MNNELEITITEEEEYNPDEWLNAYDEDLIDTTPPVLPDASGAVYNAV